MHIRQMQINLMTFVRIILLFVYTFFFNFERLR